MSKTRRSRQRDGQTPPTNSSPDDPVTAWAKLVDSGAIIAGPHIRNAAKRHLRDLTEAPKRGFEWNRDAAARPVRFFETVLRLNGGQFEGLPFKPHPSQVFIVGSLFGWLRSDGTRRFRRAYIEAAKGIGKSPMLAGVGRL